mmetsp:Transcript_10145/g.16207  ORF Transcript_10145/g.16207 Transcript_10145/m.16207 type:complete len:266 (+) Transcript_10145:610-1407(+)
MQPARQEVLPQHSLQEFAHVLGTRGQPGTEQRLDRWQPERRLHTHRLQEVLLQQEVDRSVQHCLHGRGHIVEGKRAVHEVFAGGVQRRRSLVQLPDTLGVSAKACREANNAGCLAVVLAQLPVAEVGLGIGAVRHHARSHSQEVAQRRLRPWVLGVGGPPGKVLAHGGIEVRLGMCNHRKQRGSSRPLATAAQYQLLLHRHLAICVLKDVALWRAQGQGDVLVHIVAVTRDVQMPLQPLKARKRYQWQQRRQETMAREHRCTNSS